MSCQKTSLHRQDKYYLNALNSDSYNVKRYPLKCVNMQQHLKYVRVILSFLMESNKRTLHFKLRGF